MAIRKQSICSYVMTPPPLFSVSISQKIKINNPSNTHSKYHIFVLVVAAPSALRSQRKSNSAYMGSHVAPYLTSYHLPHNINFLSPCKSTVEHYISSALMKIFFKALLKHGYINTFHLALFAATGGPILQWHHDTLSDQESPRKMYPACN